MPKENIVETDVLVIGGGIAGCFAAVKAKEQGADVTLVSKGYVGKSGQTPWAHCTAVFNPELGHNFEDWMNQVNTRGEYVNNRTLTEIMFRDSYARYQDLISWGVIFLKDEKGEIITERVRHVDPLGVSEAPIWSLLNGGVVTWVEPLRKQPLKMGVKIMERIMVVDLLKQDGRVVGAIGIPMDSSDLYIFKAKAVVLAAGTGSFKPWGGWPISDLTSDGHVMAYRAGAEITGKEFVDFHPRQVELKLRSQAERPAKPDLRSMGERPRSPLLNAEGNAVTGGGQCLGMDFEAHAGRAPLFRGETRMVSGSAPGMANHTEDGIWPADENCSTVIPGLYAAGDNLGTMVVGATYSGVGFGTAAASTTAARAGTAAARFAQQVEKPDVDEKEIARSREFVRAPAERQGGFSSAWVTQLLQNLMTPYFITRIKHGDRLQAALTIVEFMRDHLAPKLFARDPHQLRLAHETTNMIANAEMVLRSALFRTESRGCHYREDYPRRDDPNWLAWVLLKEEQGQMKAFKKPIPKEWWPDLSKPYEERYPTNFPGE